MIRQSLYFTAPRQISIREENLLDPANDQVLVQTMLSAISPGSEMLIYRGHFPGDLTIDDTIPALQGAFAYPIKYGYSAIGQVIACGARVDTSWLGKYVFSFQPHQTHFLAKLEELSALPEGMPPEEAVFLPNMETAVNFLMDGTPVIGEGVAVFGQGIVGLLTVALLAKFPLSYLVTFDQFPRRRQASLDLGANESLDPAITASIEQTRARFHIPGPYAGADLVYELSGAPSALAQAIALAGFGGRVVVGSWYGDKRVELDLGGRFHRARLRLISSQVSSIPPELSARWSKSRRMQVAWESLAQIKPARFITQRVEFPQAVQAYRLLEENPEETIQVIFTYS